MSISSDGFIFTSPLLLRSNSRLRATFPSSNSSSFLSFAAGLKESVRRELETRFKEPPHPSPRRKPPRAGRPCPHQPPSLSWHPDAVISAASRGHTYFTFANPSAGAAPGGGGGKTLCSKTLTSDWSLPSVCGKGPEAGVICNP